jgi:hypothetical protein
LNIRYSLNLIGLLAGIIIAIEGLVVMAYAAPIDVKGIGGITEQTVLIGGAQLFILGLFLVLSWIFMNQDLTTRDRKIFEKKLRIIAVLLGAIVAVEGIIVAFYAGPTFIGGIGGVLEQTVVLAGAQLFVLGTLVSISWVFKASTRSM